MVAIARRIHLFPCRTQKLSFFTPRVVGGKLPARVGSCHAVYSGLAQLVEHLTVNQVVVGSSPTTGVFILAWRVVREAEGACLESMYTGFACIKGSNPLLSVLKVMYNCK